jgi:hypothetical protein
MKEVDVRILNMWAQGLRGPEIGEELGMTHSAVMGRLFRLRQKGLVGYKVPPPVNAAKHPPPTVAAMAEPPPPPRCSRPVSEPADEFVWEPVAAPQHDFEPHILNLGANDCRYQVADKPRRFCAAPVSQRSFCAEHYALCYTKKPQLTRKEQNGLIRAFRR